MFNYRNGSKPWKIQVWENFAPKKDSGDNFIQCIFPICNTAGAIENHTPDSITKRTIGRKKINKLFGWDSQYVFHYDKWAAPVVLDNFKIIADHWQQKESYPNLQLMLFPRLDTLGRYLAVYPSEETIQIAIMRGGVNAVGNKGVILKFNAVELSSEFPIYDPNNLQTGINNFS